ncbi:glycerol kinase [Luminiphilus syltensis NOR5-1B]|uniref:glycerol kinase n=1 Tax=Luminiphilus syltensis NOR5-1B TaxID=565045 RepID=B8KRJ0_9GAMM|nr:glycerol kinase GlpK [Luminiphilus syltensis]EED35180.1 glycerol kinase [Luminiphilus syltensis NOR5-1B]
MPKVILAIDQGTTGTTVAMMDTGGNLLASVNREFPQRYPKPGWVEHNPEDIWMSVLKGIRGIFKRGSAKPADVIAIGITNQRETALLWDTDSGSSLNNAIVWQCRRTTEFCDNLKRSGAEGLVRQKTGLVLDPYFSASKYRWLLDNTPGIKSKVRKGRVAAGTIDSFLVWQLTAGEQHVTDVSNASRTSLMDIDRGDWDEDLGALFGVPLSILPEIAPSSGVLGHTRSVPGLPDGIPIAGMAGDQQSALFGQACFHTGEAKCTFGTGSFILTNTGKQRIQSKAGLLTTVAWQLKTGGPLYYALEGGAFVCGAAVQWLRDELQIIRNAADIEVLAGTVSDSNGVEFVPALTGLGAPHWDPDARGLLCGLTRGSNRGHIARATLDAMALQNADILIAMERDLGKRLKPIRVDGGASANQLLMQLQADYMGRKIIRPKVVETTVAGACFLAGLGVGVWNSTADITRSWQIDREFKVGLSAAGRRERLASWQRAIARARTGEGADG